MSDERAIRCALLAWYREHGRSSLPWRSTRDPYYTLVSECMLQQTQVDRVVPKFLAFVERFPTLAALAASSVAEVLRMWQGLGYNSRAVRLRALAIEVTQRYDGVLPRDAQALRGLPGIGPYTVAAIRAFGYDEDDAPIDTNVRRIVHRLFFGFEYPPRADARQIDARARALLPAGSAHDWSSAMMDLGASVCSARAPKCLVCPLRELCAAAPIDAAALDTARRLHAKKPSPQNALPFERTTRYARGRIVDRLRELAPGQRISLLMLYDDVQSLMPERTFEDVERLIGSLERDGLVARDGAYVALRE